MPAISSSGAASSASSEGKPITSASIPPGGVPMLPPSALSATGCRRGRSSVQASSPRRQSVAGADSARTRVRPAPRIASSAHATAAASPGVHGKRGPTSSQSERRRSHARRSERAERRSRSRCSMRGMVRRRRPRGKGHGARRGRRRAANAASRVHRLAQRGAQRFAHHVQSVAQSGRSSACGSRGCRAEKPRKAQLAPTSGVTPVSWPTACIASDAQRRGV